MTNDELDALVALIEGSKIDMLQRAHRALTTLRAERDAMEDRAEAAEARVASVAELEKVMPPAGDRSEVDRVAAWLRSGIPGNTAMLHEAADLLVQTADERIDALTYIAAIKTRALASEAAALERAAQVAYCHSDHRSRRYSMDWNDGYIDGCRGASDAIRAMITPEGRSAMGAALAEARKAGKMEWLREAAKLCEDQAAHRTEQKVELSARAVSIGDQWQVERFRVGAQQCEILAAILRGSAEAIAARVEGRDA